MITILFVCMGNICRSPLAEGIARQQAQRRNLAHITLDSAGTGAWHTGEPPDIRAQNAAKKRNINISNLKARHVTDADFIQFDLIVAMDDHNVTDLNLAAQDAGVENPNIRKLLDFAPQTHERNVPDPFYGGEDGFNHAVKLIELGVNGLLNQIAQNQIQNQNQSEND